MAFWGMISGTLVLPPPPSSTSLTQHLPGGVRPMPARGCICRPLSIDWGDLVSYPWIPLGARQQDPCPASTPSPRKRDTESSPGQTIHFAQFHYSHVQQHYCHFTPFTPKVLSGASTKLCMSGIICQCKQMSFQLLFERTSVGKFLKTKRKVIPRFRFGIEASFTEFSLQ